MGEGIAICGNIFLDHVKVVDTFPGEGMLAHILAQDRCVGGCVNNTIINLSRLESEAPLYAVGCVGADEDGRYLLQELGRYGIRTDHVSVREEGSTGYTDAIVSTRNHTRTFFNLQGVNAGFGPEDIPEDLPVRMAHLGYALLLDAMDQPDDEYGTVMARVLAGLRRRGIHTSIDVVSEESGRFQQVVIPALRFCSYLIVNEVEAGMIAGIPARNPDGALAEERLPEICRKLLSHGVEECVILHCPELGCWMGHDGEFCSVPSLALPEDQIASTVGAGDAFCAGALYGLYHRLPPEELLGLAAGAAAASLTGDSSVNGLTGLEQVAGLREKYGTERRKG